MRLAARLARAAGRVHPMDWVELYESHTTTEWLVQMGIGIVDPWGDDRADLRAAHNTLAVASSEDPQCLFNALRGYLKINERTQVVGPAAMRRLIEG